MARYYGEIQGNRGEATRMGTLASGYRAFVRGWGLGAKVTMRGKRGTLDACEVDIVAGSNNPSRSFGRLTAEEVQGGGVQVDVCLGGGYGYEPVALSLHVTATGEVLYAGANETLRDKLTR